MLELPTKGFGISTGNVHNVDLDRFCDWIEGCVLWSDDRVSQSDMVDALVEENIYRDQEFAKELISDAFKELRRRASHLGDVCP